MNIFVTDKCPYISARNLDDKRVNKMILETCQMLATALIRHGAPVSDLPKTKAGNPYRKTHEKHPCTIWVGNTQGNYQWALNHLQQLLEEFHERRHHTHACDSNFYTLVKGIKYIPPGDIQEFQNSSQFKEIKDTIEAYRLTMKLKWDHLDKLKPVWNGQSSRPSWA